MSLTGFVATRNNAHPEEFFRQLSLNDLTQKKHHKSNKKHRNPMVKKLQTSVLDLLHIEQATNSYDIPHQQQQQHEESSQCRSSMSQSSDRQRITLKKSVTFASVFDPVDNKHEKDDSANDLATLTERQLTSEEDLVTVITDNSINDQRTIGMLFHNTNKTIEPYPFRSETPLALPVSSSLPTEINHKMTSHHSRKNIMHYFILHPRPKKLRHPIQTMDPVTTTNRSMSTHNLLISAPPTSTKAITTTTNNAQHSSETKHKRFKLPSIIRLARSFGKNSDRKSNNNTVNMKNDPRHQSAELRRLSELLY